MITKQIYVRNVEKVKRFRVLKMGRKMARFSEDIIEQAWARARGICECEHEGHGHLGQCGKTLLKSFRGDKFSYFGWEANSKSGHHKDELTDCEIMCIDPCFEAILKGKQ